MAKVHAQTFLSSVAAASPSPSSKYMTRGREIFTIWMKSLICNSNGCTVYNSSGDIVYRIDNYNHNNSEEVHLMDLRGNVLFTILRKKLRVFGRWEGCKSNGSKLEQDKPWFRVRKPCRILREDAPCQVTVGSDKDHPNCYRIEGLAGKSACRIVDQEGRLVAEVKQKHSSSGVVLGNDVLSLVVEPNIDHSLIMGLVAVCGLINCSL